jgi:hypothetical protein
MGWTGAREVGWGARIDKRTDDEKVAHLVLGFEKRLIDVCLAQFQRSNPGTDSRLPQEMSIKRA